MPSNQGLKSVKVLTFLKVLTFQLSQLPHDYRIEHLLIEKWKVTIVTSLPPTLCTHLRRFNILDTPQVQLKATFSGVDFSFLELERIFGMHLNRIKVIKLGCPPKSYSRFLENFFEVGELGAFRVNTSKT